MARGSATLTVSGAIAEIVFGNDNQGFMVLTGSKPGVFVRHYDLRVLSDKAAAMAQREMVFTTDRPVPEGPIHVTMRLMEASDVIFVCALNGTAMGGGFELALACDLRLVQDGDHEFGLPEINLGILSGAGGTQRLPQIVGQSRALQMTLTGETLNPVQMVDYGLALACVEDVRAEAGALARRLAGKPARAAKHIKRLVRQAHSLRPEDLADERTLFCDLMVQDDALRFFKEGATGRRRITDAP